MPSMQPIAPARVRFEDQTPVSETYGDSYFMPGHGLSESEAVFIQPSQLAERFAALKPGELFVIGETGFGSGLNCLLAVRCFQRHAPPGAMLHLASVELHPLSRPDLARILAAWPELADWTRELLGGYPPAAPGYHRIQLADNITLTLMLGDAIQTWRDWRYPIDAWFLDGFAPARNPAMWQRDLYPAIARLSTPGASVATFTAAGHVRRGLAEAGFQVQRESGYAGKRHRTVARWPGHWQARQTRRGRALIAGAGLAGATTARALAERGWQVSVIDPAGPASAASGNHAGVVYSTPSPHLTAQNRFYQSSLIHALYWFQRLGFPGSPNQGRLNDVIFRPVDSRAVEKLSAAVDSGAWPAELLERQEDGQFRLLGAGFLSPVAWCRHLLDHPAIEYRQDRLLGFEPGEVIDSSTRCSTEQQAMIETDLLVLCNAQAAAELPGQSWLPLKIIRGQVSHCLATEASKAFKQAFCHSGYFTPALDGIHCVGASFDLHDPRPVIKPEDDVYNLDQLRQNLPEVWQALGGEAIELVGRRAALRCQSRDFLPLAGPLADPRQFPHQVHRGVMLNLAHGSRGITHTPLCASLVADLASGLPLPADPELQAALMPERFILRNRRREPDWQPAA